MKKQLLWYKMIVLCCVLCSFQYNIFLFFYDMQVAHDVVNDFAKDGVVYLELRSTPRANNAKGQ